MTVCGNDLKFFEIFILSVCTDEFVVLQCCVKLFCGCEVLFDHAVYNNIIHLSLRWLMHVILLLVRTEIRNFCV